MTAAGLEKVSLPHGIEEPVRLHFHDLRGTAVTILSECGCNEQQIATITGHRLGTVSRILERYLARTRGLAEQAIQNFEASPRAAFVNSLRTSICKPAANQAPADKPRTRKHKVKD